MPAVQSFWKAACVLGGGEEGCVVGCPSRVLALGVGERPGGLQRSLTAWDLQRGGALSLRILDAPRTSSDCWKVLGWSSLRQAGDALREHAVTVASPEKESALG